MNLRKVAEAVEVMRASQSKAIWLNCSGGDVEKVRSQAQRDYPLHRLDVINPLGCVGACESTYILCTDGSISDMMDALPRTLAPPCAR